MLKTYQNYTLLVEKQALGWMYQNKFFLLPFRRFAARRGPVSVMNSDNAQTFRCVSRNLKFLHADPSIHDLLAMQKVSWIFSASLEP
jgi:hypothetical protein